MREKTQIVYLFLYALIISVALNGCSFLKPQSKEEIYARFLEAREDIEVVVDYFLSSNYDDIFITDANEPVFADFTYIELKGAIAGAAHSLFKEYKFLELSKHSHNNTLVFRMWTNKLNCDCGVLYAINNDKAPYTEYLTMLEPLPESGWYYYVVDFDEWRANNP